MVAVGLIGLAFGSWYFFDELLLVWLGFLQLLKGFQFKKLMIGAWALLLPLFKRLLILEIPKKILMGLAWVGLGPDARRWIRARSRLIRLWLRKTRRKIEARFRWITGKHIALFISIVVTLGIFFVSLFGFGIYLVWWVGAIRIPTSIWRLFSFGGRMVTNNVFKAVAFFKLNKVWEFIHERFPHHVVVRYKLAKRRFLRATSKSGQATLKRAGSGVKRLQPLGRTLREKLPMGSSEIINQADTTAETAHTADHKDQ